MKRHKKCHVKIKDWGDAHQTKKHPRLPENHQKPGKDKENSPQFSEGAWLCQHLDFRVLGSRNTRH